MLWRAVAGCDGLQLPILALHDPRTLKLRAVFAVRCSCVIELRSIIYKNMYSNAVLCLPVLGNGTGLWNTEEGILGCLI